MLTSIAIANFAIVESLELELRKGMTVISGETGAGKSIMVDALSLCLGARTDSGVVRHGEKKAEISATFDVSNNINATKWLHDRDLESDQYCILRRIITKEGKSKAYINNRPCALADLKTIGSYLIDIHGQHEHQSLLKKSAQRVQIDAFGGLNSLSHKVKSQYQDWKKMRDELNARLTRSTDQESRIQLLTYQVQELEVLNLKGGELKALEEEQKFLATIADAQQKVYQTNLLLAEEEDSNIRSLLNHALLTASSIQTRTPHLQSACDLMNEAIIQIEEACNSLSHYQDTLEQDPARLNEVEQRLSDIYDTARKHKTTPEELVLLQETLTADLNDIIGSNENLDVLKEKEEKAYQALTEMATELTEQRMKAKEVLATKVEEQIHGLGMPYAQFQIHCHPLDEVTANGFEEIEYMIASNPGQPAQPLRKVASGGELSRISLGIQVITASTSTIPTLIFDEVDVGISGGIAEVVGRMLRSVGTKGQVFCVTHLAQVAAQGHQHLLVQKQVEQDHTSSQVTTLHKKDRTVEIARLLGGLELTQQTLAHAREMLGNVHLQ